MTPRQRVIDALSFKEPDRVPIDLGTTVTCIEIEAYRELKKEFGKDMVFWSGAVDTQKTLSFGKPEEVAAEVREAMALLAPCDGYVFTQVHNIQIETPPENILAMFEAAETFGRYT